MKYSIMHVVLSFMVIFAVGSVNILGSINSNEPVKPGEEFNLVVNLKNPTFNNYRDLSVKAIFLDFPDYIISGNFNLDDKSVKYVQLSVDVPKNAYSGDHIVKIIAENDDVRDVKYVYVRVI
jgi:hypothetical protein